MPNVEDAGAPFPEDDIDPSVPMTVAEMLQEWCTHLPFEYPLRTPRWRDRRARLNRQMGPGRAAHRAAGAG